MSDRGRQFGMAAMLGAYLSLAAGLSLAACLSLGATSAMANPEATAVRVGKHAGSTRFVIDLSERVTHNIFLLADPYRVVIDLPEISWRIARAKRAKGTGFVDRYRYGLFKPGTSRMVLDLSGPAAIRKAFIIAPKGKVRHYRLVIDLTAVDRPTFLAAVGRYKKARLAEARIKPRPPSTRLAAKPRPPNRRPVIVIDPGHGGVDPGTSGARGQAEKNLTLAIGLELRRRLAADSRFTVVMTRSRDIFIPLRKRVEIARHAGADLLISMHLDALKDPRVRGATVYTLSEKASDREAATLAAKENKSDIIAGIDLDHESRVVASILIDLAQRETMNYSAQLAALVLPELGHRVALRTNSHRFANFRVLKAPDVPSVLIEMGYLSNRKDAAMLASKAGRQGIAEALHKAIGKYFLNHRS